MRFFSFISCCILLLMFMMPSITFAKNTNDEETINNLMNKMSPKEKIGQLVMPDSDANSESFIKDYYAGSIIIYGHYDAVTTANYTNQLQAWANETAGEIPLFISADLEYGAVQHVTDATVFPRQMGIGATKDYAAAKKIAQITAKEARAVGYNWNYSPVADVNVNPVNPVIGVRAFGESTELVTDLSLAMIEGHQEENVLATVKHFPGHGDTFIDSHFGIDTVTYDRDTLDTIHLAPFKAAIDAGVDAVMTSHIIVEAIDADLPATLSKKVLTNLLREELAFDGIIITDAMDMGAMVNNFGRGEAAVKYILAGGDIIIAKGSYNEIIETFEGLYEAYESGELTIERIDESVERILSKKLKSNLFENPFVDVEQANEIINTNSHKDFAREVARQSITVVKNEAVLPFDSTTSEKTLVVGPRIYNQTSFIEDIARQVESMVNGTVDYVLVPDDPTSTDIKNVAQMADDYERIIVATFSASELPLGQAELVVELTNTARPVVAISLGLPYDLQHYPDVDAYIATYAIERWGSPVPTAWNAAVDVIFGEKPGGTLPVTIEGIADYGTGLEFQSNEKSPADQAGNKVAKNHTEKKHNENEKKKGIPYPFYFIPLIVILFIFIFFKKK